MRSHIRRFGRVAATLATALAAVGALWSPSTATAQCAV